MAATTTPAAAVPPPTAAVPPAPVVTVPLPSLMNANDPEVLLPESRPKLLALLRTLSLRHDELGQEVVLNNALLNLISANLFGQAEELVANSPLQQPYRSTNQAAKFFYYQGLIQAMRLEYTGAHQTLLQALRKAPERALGFRIAATKLFVVVQLLMGEIPPRSEFLQRDMKEQLQPYLLLASCVRFGNLGRFASIANKYQSQFEHDRTYPLILRVRQHVLKMGLRRMCQAYKRLPIRDICVKLAVDHPDDAEYIVAKAIRDGVIDAVLDHERGHIVTAETADVYTTAEPLHAFQRRVQFCNAVYDEARRAMRYATEDLDDDETLKKKEADKRDALARALEDGDGGADLDFFDGI